MPLHVLISGAGLAGPALAIALARHSIRSTILERHAVSQNIGGVIMLAPNAMHVMNGIVGVGDALRAAGESFPAINIYTKGAGAAPLVQVGGFHIEDEGIMGLSIARPVLHQTLLARCGELKEVEVRYGAKVAKIDEGAEGVKVVLESGETVRDGIGSVARQHVLGKANVQAEYAGYMSVGCIVPRARANLPADMALPAFLYTPSGTFLIFAMDGRGDEIQWATSITVPEVTPRRDWSKYHHTGEAVRVVKAEYASVTTEPIRTFVDYLDNDNLKLWAPYQVPPIPKWHTDRVVLVGDAAHAVSPSVGQGSAQAFEDVGLLARLLAEPTAMEKGLPAVFAHYERTRRPRVEEVQKAAARAEGGRGKTGPVMWLVKSWGMWAGLKLFGKDGYLKGGLSTYDVTKASIVVG